MFFEDFASSSNTHGFSTRTAMPTYVSFATYTQNPVMINGHRTNRQVRFAFRPLSLISKVISRKVASRPKSQFRSTVAQFVQK